MKNLAAFLVIISFFGVAVLGFASVSHSAGHESPNCFVGSIAGGLDCPESIIGFVRYHVSALQSLTMVLIIAAFAFAAFLFAVAFFSPPSRAPDAYRRFSKRLRELASLSMLSRRKFIRFLAIFEHSPSF